MRRMVVLAVLAAALMALGAGTVLAQEGVVEDEGAAIQGGKLVTDKAGNQRIQCTGVPCTASGSSDLVFERRGQGAKDRILLKGGRDQVRAAGYGQDKDVIKGSAGFDLIFVDDGDVRDRIFGGRGNDKCYVDARIEVVRGCSEVIVR